MKNLSICTIFSNWPLQSVFTQPIPSNSSKERYNLRDFFEHSIWCEIGLSIAHFIHDFNDDLSIRLSAFNWFHNLSYSLYTTLETELLGVDSGRIVSVKTLAEIKDETYRDLGALNKLLGGLSLLLMAVTSLGVIGLTSFSVTQRTRQIGTRRALGATRLAILRYFMLENWIVTGIGLLIGIALTYGLNFMLAQLAEVQKIGWPLVVSGMIALWVVGLLAALAPALRGTLVPPVVATRSV